MAIKVQLRRGTASQWSTTNPLLAEGELGLELDTGKFKIGNGTQLWNALVYASGIQGPTGPAGVAGANGATGPAGVDGVAGPTGLRGPTGVAGPAGDGGRGEEPQRGWQGRGPRDRARGGGRRHRSCAAPHA